MKKLLVTALTLGILLALTACGGEAITLATKTVNGISMSVPSDFGEFAEKDGAMVAANKDNTATISITAAGDGGGLVPADIDQDTYQQQAYSGVSDVEFSSYNNAASCNGIPAISAVCKVKNAKGIAVMTYSYLLFHEDGTIQGVSLNYNTDVSNSVKDNVDAMANSIKAE